MLKKIYNFIIGCALSCTSILFASQPAKHNVMAPEMSRSDNMNARYLSDQTFGDRPRIEHIIVGLRFGWFNTTVTQPSGTLPNTSNNCTQKATLDPALQHAINAGNAKKLTPPVRMMSRIDNSCCACKPCTTTIVCEPCGCCISGRVTPIRALK